MSTNRREFLSKSLAAAGAVSLGIGPALSDAAGAAGSVGAAGAAGTGPSLSLSAKPGAASGERSGHPLRILILGGTSFLGPHLIAYALGRGHDLTIFTRGRTKPTIHKGLFEHVRHLTGDRGGDLSALEGERWDVVIDNSGHNADWTRDSAELLKDSVDLYLYTSSTGVYYPYLGEHITEQTEVVLVEPPNAGEDSWYGVMKSQSELAARGSFGDERTIVVRPTYIIGPGDQSDRFPYWPARLERGGEVMGPGKGQDPVQFIDVRDLTEWMIHLAERRAAGTYNVVGPASRMGMHEFLFGAHAATSSAVEWVMIPDYDFLMENNVPYVVPWIMPVDDNYGSARASNEHALANGLTYRPLADSVFATLGWWHSDAVTQERRDNLLSNPSGLMAREPGIIEAWRSRG